MSEGYLEFPAGAVNVAVEQIQTVEATGTINTSTIPHIVAISCGTGQHYELTISGYDEMHQADTSVSLEQFQEVSATGTIAYPPEPPTPPREAPNRGGSGHYYGPWGAEYIVPLDLSHLLGTHDPATMFGGDQSERPNATTATGKAVPVEEELSFIKSLPPPKVDDSMSFIKSLGKPEPIIVNEEDDLVVELEEQVKPNTQKEAILECTMVAPIKEVTSTSTTAHEIAETLQKTSKLLQMSAKSMLAGQYNPNPETLVRMVSMIKECVENLESKLPK